MGYPTDEFEGHGVHTNQIHSKSPEDVPTRVNTGKGVEINSIHSMVASALAQFSPNVTVAK